MASRGTSGRLFPVCSTACDSMDCSEDEDVGPLLETVCLEDESDFDNEAFQGRGRRLTTADFIGSSPVLAVKRKLYEFRRLRSHKGLFSRGLYWGWGRKPPRTGVLNPVQVDAVLCGETALRSPTELMAIPRPTTPASAVLALLQSLLALQEEEQKAQLVLAAGVGQQEAAESESALWREFFESAAESVPCEQRLEEVLEAKDDQMPQVQQIEQMREEDAEALELVEVGEAAEALRKEDFAKISDAISELGNKIYKKKQQVVEALEALAEQRRLLQSSGFVLPARVLLVHGNMSMSCTDTRISAHLLSFCSSLVDALSLGHGEKAEDAVESVYSICERYSYLIGCITALSSAFHALAELRTQRNSREALNRMEMGAADNNSKETQCSVAAKAQGTSNGKKKGAHSSTRGKAGKKQAKPKRSATKDEAVANNKGATRRKGSSAASGDKKGRSRKRTKATTRKKAKKAKSVARLSTGAQKVPKKTQSASAASGQNAKAAAAAGKKARVASKEAATVKTSSCTTSRESEKSNNCVDVGIQAGQAEIDGTWEERPLWLHAEDPIEEEPNVSSSQPLREGEGGLAVSGSSSVAGEADTGSSPKEAEGSQRRQSKAAVLRFIVDEDELNEALSKADAGALETPEDSDNSAEAAAAAVCPSRIELGVDLSACGASVGIEEDEESSSTAESLDSSFFEPPDISFSGGTEFLGSRLGWRRRPEEVLSRSGEETVSASASHNTNFEFDALVCLRSKSMRESVRSKVGDLIRGASSQSSEAKRVADLPAARASTLPAARSKSFALAGGVGGSSASLVKTNRRAVRSAEGA